ncbi:hypothetical protein ACFXEL_27550 [Streptomyces sp. NPDC059382]
MRRFVIWRNRNADDNETGGTKLNEMSTLNCVLDGDAFHVKITL